MSVAKRGGKNYTFTIWWRGEKIRRSTKTSNKEAAQQIEAAARIALAKGEFDLDVQPKRRRKIEELLDDLEADLKVRGRLSKKNISNIKQVRAHFGKMRTNEVTAEKVKAYIDRMVADEYAPASVNRRTQLLAQSFRLAQLPVPRIPRLSEIGNVRKGFFSEPELRRQVQLLPDYLQDATLFAFLCGWRRGEVFSLAWDDVDDDCIRLRAEHAKDEEGRVLVLVGELADIIERRKKVKKGPLVFHHDGAAITDFRKAWAKAAKLAQVEGKHFHDLRRSSVRNMIRAGVSEHVAMQVSGHRTQSMLDRYNIVSEGDIRSAMVRTAEYLKAQAEAAKKETVH
jgi:integrase